MKSQNPAERIFHEALEQALEQRGAYVEAACEGDEALLRDVRSLLDSHLRAEGFLEGAAIGAAAQIVEGQDPMLGRQIGAFTILESIGSGGMGRVYLAERVQEEFTQRAAIKIIRRGYDGEALRRFRNECQVLAMLEHPNIARMIDGGFTADGSPFIIMEYVDGVPVDEYCDTQELSVNQRLDLFRTICSAVHHAHMHSTIHRDLKPSNILVDRSGTVKLVDFGIARILDAADGVVMERTQTGQQMLTPLYASPEQLSGALLSTATDIYSLGVVLFKLLTDRVPYAVPKGSIQEMAQVLDSPGPTKPSEVVLDTESGGTTTLIGDTKKRSRQLRGDLDTIVLMSMRKEPERRYASAEQFSEDIHRHLKGMPVIAQPDTLSYRASKFVRRNAVGVVAAVIIALVLLASSGVVFTLYREARVERAEAERARDLARENEKTADAVAGFLTDLFEEASPENTQGKELSARDLVDRGAEKVQTELDDEPAIKARVMKTVGDVYTSLSEPQAARPLLEESIRIEREIHGDTHASLASALRAYGDLLAEEGDHEAALVNHLEALAVMRRLYGPSDRRLPPFMNRIALNSPRMPYDEKISMFRRSLAIIEQQNGADDPLVAYYLVNLSGALRRGGEYEEAYELMLRSLEIREAALGPDHALVAVSLGSLGTTLNKMGEYEKALPIAERALALRRKIYGDKSLYLTMSLNSVANTYVGLGRYDEARTLLVEAIEIKELLFGDTHPYIGFDEVDLGTSYLREGRPQLALSHLERSEQLLSAAYGASSHELGYPLTARGEAEAALGQHAAALPYYERALEVRGSLREGHPLVEDTVELYLVSLRALGREDEAVQLEARYPRAVGH